ncbi:MAG: hypothetical protein EB078_11550 [Proteobacteria bacterium]|nr:hypothetical protein [Pseudomonadota bacterium]
MRKIAEGEILIHTQKSGKNVEDLRKGLSGLRGESQRFGITSSGLSRSFLGVNSSAGLANKSLMLLGRAGAIGAGIALVYKAVMGVAEAFDNMGEQAKQSGKAMDKAFASGIASKSVEGTTAAIDALKQQQDDLIKQASEVNIFRSMLKGFEAMTGMNLGGSRLETDIETINKNIAAMEKQKELRKQEEKALLEIRKEEQAIDKQRSVSGMKRRLEALQGAREDDLAVQSASDEVNYEMEKLRLAEREFAVIMQRNKIAPDQKALNEAQLKVDRARLSVAEKQLAVQEQTAKAREKEFKQSSGFGAEILESTAAGRGALETARRKRKRQVRDENYRIAQEMAPTYAEKEALAAQVAAVEQTTLGERLLTAGKPALSAEQVASQRVGFGGFGAISRFIREGRTFGERPLEKSGMLFEATGTDKILADIKVSIDDLTKNISTAPLVTAGNGQ